MLRTGLIATVASALVLAGCGGDGDASAARPTVPSAPPSASTTSPTAPSPTTTKSKPGRFSADVKKIPSRAKVKHSWRPGCPVPLSGLRLIRMTYWGMDRKVHTGELIVHATVARDVVSVFRKLYGFRYPVKRMELVDKYKGSDFQSIEADNTSAFNCRKATGSSSVWSQHSYGKAIDINPCENPYVHTSGHIEHPKCVKYGKRSRRDPGVIHAGDRVVRAFASVGWKWGGNWPGIKDYQHFSATGR